MLMRLLLTVLLLVAGSVTADDLPVYAFRNGQWWDGTAFHRATVYAVDGRFTFKKPQRIDRSIDLENTFVLPPFGEAHNHNLTSPGLVKEMGPIYLREGVFYAKMQSNLPHFTGVIRHRLNRRDSVDVTFANGPLTATGGHPVALRHMLLERGVYPGFTKESLETQGYFLIDDKRDLESTWPTILEFRPDFIKTVLVASEEYEKRKDDASYFGRKGLQPELLKDIVALAHDHDLRVSAHVNTARDFHHAVAAGVDEIAHLPGSHGPELIPAADAELAAKKKIVVVTTACLALRRRANEELFAKIRAAQIENLKLLHTSGVTLAIGSDEVEQTSRGEVAYLRELGVFDNATLIRMWSENTVRTIFPERRVGALREGYEASFIAVEGNPLDEIASLDKIKFRFKQGLLLPPANR
jgi:hypothetical protein